jgi:hypothetical protein
VKRSSTVFIIGVPDGVTADDVAHVNKVLSANVRRAVRVINTHRRQSSLLIDFINEDVAASFFESANGNTFDAHNQQAEICRAMYCSRVTFQAADSAPPVLEGHAELPSCPRCVERLDTSASGLVPRMSARGALAFSTNNSNSMTTNNSNGVPWATLACSVCVQLSKTSALVVDGSHKTASSSTPAVAPVATPVAAVTVATQPTPATVIAPKPSASSYDALPRLGKSPSLSSTTPPNITSSSSSSSSSSSTLSSTTTVVATPASSLPLISNAAVAAVTALSWTSCAQCSVRGDAREALWMCLICGHIGCGRYQASHAVQHYTKTHHRYSIELQNQFIWDYIGDGYVHRAGWGRAGPLPATPALHGINGNGNGNGDDCGAPSSMHDNILDDVQLDAEEQDMMNTKLQSIEAYYDHLLTRYVCIGK